MPPWPMPLAPVAVSAEPEPMRFERLIRALRALAAWLPSTEAPNRVQEPR